MLLLLWILTEIVGQFLESATENPAPEIFWQSGLSDDLEFNGVTNPEGRFNGVTRKRTFSTPIGVLRTKIMLFLYLNAFPKTEFVRTYERGGILKPRFW
jgi:hypothetical protein